MPHLHLHPTFHPLLSIAAGVLILIQPKLLSYVVAFYLVFTGVMELLK